MRQRRFLPSISMLLAFEAVVRSGSVTAAAHELNLTQSTVSRLVQNLEQQIGCVLFLRRRKRLVPTEAALAYRDKIALGLDMIQRAGMGLIANPGGGTLSLAVLPTFGTRWLAPRLSGFFDRNPGVSINLATRVKRFVFDAEGFDAAIYFGEADWPGARHLKLFDERYTACAPRAFLDSHPIVRAEDLAAEPLLLLESRTTAWNDWFQGQGAAARPISGMVMDQFSMMIQSAISGFGIALLPDYLADLETREDRLAPILTPSIPGAGSYWLAWPERNDPLAPLECFRDWLSGECRDFAAERSGEQSG
ncbi:LysR family transcriptional regulator [Tropicimonas sp. IMCC34043]|uniref:LysR family transcriptional regulator n=1 Tax=Tropicimonas sp. IMCC34043 TaxID=2248760 RepID=UPI000E2741ED|nr:LysR family transcriptional regulator [Tropicimonas sp. IMCC34043]